MPRSAGENGLVLLLCALTMACAVAPAQAQSVRPSVPVILDDLIDPPSWLSRGSGARRRRRAPARRDAEVTNVSIDLMPTLDAAGITTRARLVHRFAHRADVRLDLLETGYVSRRREGDAYVGGASMALGIDAARYGLRVGGGASRALGLMQLGPEVDPPTPAGPFFPPRVRPFGVLGVRLGQPERHLFDLELRLGEGMRPDGTADLALGAGVSVAFRVARHQLVFDSSFGNLNLPFYSGGLLLRLAIDQAARSYLRVGGRFSTVSTRGARVVGAYVESTDFLAGSLLVGYERRFGPGFEPLPASVADADFSDPARMHARARRTWRIAGGAGQLVAYLGGLLFVDLLLECPLRDPDTERCDPVNYTLAGSSMIAVGATTTALAAHRSRRLHRRADAREAQRRERQRAEDGAGVEPSSEGDTDAEPGADAAAAP